MTSKNNQRTTNTPVLKKKKTINALSLYELNTNGLRVLFMPTPNDGIVTSHIVYKVGSRDEARGETGLAHMLEHMLFKPTTHDLKRGIDSAAMQFERETGVILNANTWKDRTCYYFSYPRQYVERALQIESERMRDTVLSDAEFIPERANVLSEFDMYAGDEDFVLSVDIVGTALHAHPYGHETIGYREDIESYTCEKLQQFYNTHYTPDNATLIIVGDISESEMKKVVVRHFGHIPSSSHRLPRLSVREPAQKGMRTTHVKRLSQKNILTLAFPHAGFPSKEWYETMVLLALLAGDDDSLLHKQFVDRGLALKITATLEPTFDKNIGMLSVHLTKKTNHEKMYRDIQKCIAHLTRVEIKPYLKKIIAKHITDERVTRSSSLGLAQELVEFESAYAWERFFESEQMLRSITADDILVRARETFNEDTLTVGSFIGTTS